MEEKEQLTPAVAQTQETAAHSLPQKITKDNIHAGEMTTKGKVLHWIKLTICVLISSFLVSIASYSLIAPNDFTIGGVTGLAILINLATDGRVPQSLLLLCFNVPLLVLAFIFVRRKFVVLSIMNIGMQTLWLTVFEQFIPDFQIAFTDGGPASKIFAAIAAGLCIGSATALALKVGGSTGGADIIAVLIQKKVGATSIAFMILCINVVVVGASFFVFYDNTMPIAYNLLPVMLSVFESYIESKTNEAITNGFQSAREFRIITDKPDEMAKALMKELRRGVTALPATGMYTKITHTMLLCVVSRRQVGTLKRVMKQIDPDSFAVMSNVSQVLGLGFYIEEI